MQSAESITTKANPMLGEDLGRGCETGTRLDGHAPLLDQIVYSDHWAALLACTNFSAHALART